jgi:hypothetical protein
LGLENDPVLVRHGYPLRTLMVFPFRIATVTGNGINGQGRCRQVCSPVVR